MLARRVQIFLLCLGVAAATASIGLRFERTNGLNEITLTCRKNANPIASAVFWLNSTDQLLTTLLSPSEYTIPSVGQFHFNITPELEGDYFCSPPGEPGMISSRQRLVAVPQPDPEVQLVYAEECGSSVTLQCSFRLGALQEQYSVSWSRGGIFLVSTSHPESHNGLYRLDPSTFTLTIDPIAVDLESSEYKCDIDVGIPFGGGNFHMGGPKVTLRVYGSISAQYMCNSTVGIRDQVGICSTLEMCDPINNPSCCQPCQWEPLPVQTEGGIQLLSRNDTTPHGFATAELPAVEDRETPRPCGSITIDEFSDNTTSYVLVWAETFQEGVRVCVEQVGSGGRVCRSGRVYFCEVAIAQNARVKFTCDSCESSQQSFYFLIRTQTLAADSDQFCIYAVSDQAYPSDLSTTSPTSTMSRLSTISPTSTTSRQESRLPTISPLFTPSTVSATPASTPSLPNDGSSERGKPTILGAIIGGVSVALFVILVLIAVAFAIGCLSQQHPKPKDHVYDDPIELCPRSAAVVHAKAADSDGYSDPRYHDEITDKDGYARPYFVHDANVSAPHTNAPTRADMASDSYSDPRYRGELERDSSADPHVTDENGCTQLDVHDSNVSASHTNAPTRADMASDGYSDPRYHGEITDKDGYARPYYVHDTNVSAPHTNTPTRADMGSDGYSDPRYHGEQERDSSADPHIINDNGCTQLDVHDSNVSASHTNAPTRADMGSDGYSDPRYRDEACQENGLSAECTDPHISDESGYTRPDVHGSSAAADFNTPTRTDLEGGGYSDPRYYGAQRT